MNWKQRVLRELLLLNDKITLLEKHIENDKSEILCKQLTGMMTYRDCLIERLDKELEEIEECLK